MNICDCIIQGERFPGLTHDATFGQSWELVLNVIRWMDDWVLSKRQARVPTGGDEGSTCNFWIIAPKGSKVAVLLLVLRNCIFPKSDGRNFLSLSWFKSLLTYSRATFLPPEIFWACACPSPTKLRPFSLRTYLPWWLTLQLELVNWETQFVVKV